MDERKKNARKRKALKQRIGSQQRSLAEPSRPRNQTLDALRGLAILLMILDHLAGIWFQITIEPTSVRMLTRLSMPLFAVLMGYFLAGSSRFRWDRFGQIVAAAAAINLFYLQIYGELEILASLLVCYCLHVALGPFYVGLFVAAYFIGIDPSTNYFDYPVTVVASCVAQGAIIKHHGWRIALFTSALLCAAIPLSEPPTQYAIYFIPLATGLVAWGAAQPNHTVRSLGLIGRYPLTTYLVQYAIILALRPWT